MKGLSYFFILLVWGCWAHLQAQPSLIKLKIKVLDIYENPIKNAVLHIQGTSLQAISDTMGVCSIVFPTNGNYTLEVNASDFEPYTKNIQVFPANNPLLKVVLLATAPTRNWDTIGRPIPVKNQDFEIQANEAFLLSETDLEALSEETPAVFLLQATRDVFLGSAAFDFSQAFFKPKSLDSRFGQVFLNGMGMNKWYYGRPQWSDWGGLNTLTRNQNYSHGIASQAGDFGGLQGTTFIDLSPSKQRSGLSFSTSLSNRSYATRQLFSYVSPVKGGFSFAFGGSIRNAARGYQEGTPYKAYSGMGTLEYKKGRHTFSGTYLYTYNKRGRAAALTQEVVALLGAQYNPYWGMHQGKVRQARNKTLVQNTIILNHSFEGKTTEWSTTLGGISGKDLRSRLAYFNAPNPDPLYYKKLPSYYLNSPIGANYYAANTAAEALLDAPQINWDRMYVANATLFSKNKLAYMESGDQALERQLNITSRFLWKPTETQQVDIGIAWRWHPMRFYGEILDNFGGALHPDIDPFSQTRNDILGPLYKNQGQVYGYDYSLNAQGGRAYMQWRYYGSRWDAFASVEGQRRVGYREGYMQNERYLETSLGQGSSLAFGGLSYKLGITYKYNGRHWFSLAAFKGNTPPNTSLWFVNPRDHQLPAPNLKTEKIHFASFNYILRAPALMGRFNLFWGTFRDQASLRFFFAETALGSDFVQEWVNQQNTRHFGAEFGFSYALSSSVKLNFSGSLGQYQITNNPSVTLFFDTDPLEQNPINTLGVQDFGQAALKGTQLPLGPARAFSFSISYRDPKYWWLSMSMNTMGLAYSSPSYLRHTPSFLLNAETGLPTPDPIGATSLLKQWALPSFYLVNLVGGKSWLKKGRYISAFLSVNNLFNTYYRSGGYAQSRKAHYTAFEADQRSGQPSFDTKYWQGGRRTFFLNLMISLPPSALKKPNRIKE